MHAAIGKLNSHRAAADLRHDADLAAAMSAMDDDMSVLPVLGAPPEFY